ncbi:hypothetical protein HETIRDRAFT_415584 [Heterobasidion irregulare TC 32-1]|uniref:Xylanolytic transcriptional activator regulatory domain-containing protein n=1 Tax=Heterobasidion irregulare (strain TC 32-1) TaxID=747525 RepID=W4KEW3_HETIT|nr:uncharacterized protein HETIRDRAFT_415584 [Heterobasidion irregulare TC 32-1]ETW83845.1 hypothetical protein HETIRDRAFT_415584 [Heterobasidion irregulare TC 32-1]
MIHRPYFNNCYTTFSNGPIPPSLEFTALLAIVCATALQFLPESDEDEFIFADYPQGRQILKKRMYDFTRSVLVTTASPPVSSIERIRALTLFSVYQWNEGNAAECYFASALAIRMAQTLAMNRDGETTWHMRPQDAEWRRRLWWTLFVFDRFHAVEYCRPYVIFEHHTDVAASMNLDEISLETDDELVPKSMEEPTDSLYLIIQSRWAQLIGQIWDSCFAINLPTYRTVVDFENRIRKFELDLPASFRYQSPQVAQSRPYLQFQVCMSIGYL